MGLKRYKPHTPSLRFLSRSDYADITKSKPEKSLLRPKKQRAGRNNAGRITVRHRGGGHKRNYRIIDFKRYDKNSIPAKVHSIEYDPNRSARIALLHYVDGEKRYIIAPIGLSVGDTVISGPDVDIQPGNALPLKNIPLGTIVHNIELKEGKGGQMVRSAGGGARIMAKEGVEIQIKLPSGEVRIVSNRCYATIGQIGNVDHENQVWGKAGRTRWLGIRPTVRGVVMNPVDHPHGGGEGRAGQGNPHPVTPWGQPTKGYRTRKKKPSDKYIVRRRHKRRK
tara:strand:- start:21 stop:860 length:840 start_codon:yes stop_codon:yes gene_type:complete